MQRLCACTDGYVYALRFAMDGKRVVANTPPGVSESETERVRPKTESEGEIDTDRVRPDAMSEREKESDRCE